MIVLSDISRYHGKDKDAFFVLRRLNLRVADNDRIGIMGQSGCGKSTLARIACGVERPDEGWVTHSGHVSWPIGFSGYLHKEMTGEDNVRTVSGLLGGDTDRVLAFVTSFSGLGSKMKQKVGTYSSFARDRLAVACSIAFPADTYVVDGIPGLGDQDFQNRYIAELKKRLSHSGLLFLTRNRRHLEALCDRFFALRDGVLYPASSPEEAVALSNSSSVEVVG